MITVPGLAADALGSFLAARMTRRFGSANANFIELIQSAASLALDCIGNSDALYHNVEHTMFVTLVGYDIERTIPPGFDIRERLHPFSHWLPLSRNRLRSRRTQRRQRRGLHY